MLNPRDHFDYRYAGQRVVLAAAQNYFDTHTGTFASLIQLVDSKGEPFDRQRDFPSRGDVWWMLTSQTLSFAEPGRLIMAVLEEARVSEDEDKARYQVLPDSIEAVRDDLVVEIVRVPADAATVARDLIHPRFAMNMDHPPSPIVYALWKESLFGPLYTTSTRLDTGIYQVQFKPARETGAVNIIPWSIISGDVTDLETTVSSTNRPVYQGGEPVQCAYSLISRRQLNPALTDARTEIWKTPGEIMREVTKRLFDERLIFKKDRQSFLKLFEGVEEVVAQRPDLLKGPEERDILKLVRDNIDVIRNEAQELADAVVNSGLVDELVQNSIEKRAEEYVNQRSSELRARVEEQVKERRSELEALVEKCSVQEEELRTQREREMKEIQKAREEARIATAKETASLAEQQKALDEQRRIVSDTMTRAAESLRNEQDQVVQQFLTLSPLFKELGVMRPTEDHQAHERPERDGEAAGASEFVLSPFVTRESPAQRMLVDEDEFFDRFRAHVANSGFWHREIDLVAFHLSVKSNDVTILGGQPGTGKSSLPSLYAEALQGDEELEGSRYLHVSVSPSWVDSRDLLGYVNAFTRSFQPSESGLYIHLVNSSEEEKRRGLDSGIWLTCLDEMNLAQVEHYFGVFLQVLEAPAGSRKVPCFAPHLVSSKDPFHPWASINLARSIRFAGTVNFDETTRQLSQRLLDRASLIRLRPPRSALQASAPVAKPRPSGPAVNLASLNEWMKRGERMPEDVGRVVDRLQEPLTRLGCPINPRRFRAMSKFIANAPESLCHPRKALDLQIAHRLLPRVRGLFRSGAAESVAQLKKLLQEERDLTESLVTLEEICSEAGGGWMAQAEEEETVSW